MYRHGLCRCPRLVEAEARIAYKVRVLCSQLYHQVTFCVFDGTVFLQPVSPPRRLLVLGAGVPAGWESKIINGNVVYIDHANQVRACGTGLPCM